MIIDFLDIIELSRSLEPSKNGSKDSSEDSHNVP